MHYKPTGPERLKNKFSLLITGDPSPHLHSESKRWRFRLTFRCKKSVKLDCGSQEKFDIRYSEKEKGPFLTWYIQAPGKG